MEKTTISQDPVSIVDRNIRMQPFGAFRNTSDSNSTGNTFTLGDFYYILFRHKWAIFICSLLGIGGAIALYITRPIPYQSEAKLLIRYVLDNKTLAPATSTGAPDSRVKSPDERGETIINSEVEILTSLDLAQKVVELVGAEKILKNAGGGNDSTKAALMVQKGLTVEVPKNSSVVHIAFQHPDPEITQSVLRQLVDTYFKKHVEIHRSVGALDEFLFQQTDQLRSRLSQTEQDLRQARSKAGVLSLEDSKKLYTVQIAKLREEYFSAQAELAERKARLGKLAKQEGDGKSSGNTGDVLAAAGLSTEEYKNLLSRIDFLRKKEMSLLSEFTAENQRVKEVRAQIAELDKNKRGYESKYPSLLLQKDTVLDDGPTEVARVAALESKIKVINEQLELMKSEAANVDAQEPTITELQRKKELEEANYRYFSANLEQSRIDEALSAGKVSNISIVQSPTPPFWSPFKTLKVIAVVFFGGLILGLAWAMSIELVFDRSVKRPIEVENKLGMKLLLSIPSLKKKSGGKNRFAWKKPKVISEDSIDEALVAPATDELQRDTLHHKSELNAFFEALRDRLVVYFHVRNMLHKPKLIALTGASNGAGVTLTAVGLAASLSETGDGNVLLVDMHPDHEAAQHFYKGKPVVGLDLAISTKDLAMVQENLYVVSARSILGMGEKLPKLMPKTISNLVPQLKADQHYDYIIFDMPPITQTSVTPRLAGLMDMVLFVIEAEKTNCDIVRQANALLKDSKANICAILNKTRNYIPRWLHQEFLSET